MQDQRNVVRRQQRHIGIRVRHSRYCPSRSGGTCTKGKAGGCVPYYEAWVYDRTQGKKIRKTFSQLAAAKLWRADATGAVRRGALRASARQTVREAGEEWLAGAKSGAIRTRSGDVWKPSTLHSYEQTLRLRVLPILGGAQLSDITAADLQRFVERLLEQGLDASTVRNALMPLRAIYRRACRPGGPVQVNPTRGLELPAVRGRRDRIIEVNEASRLLAELAEDERALWATALYSGLRRGELLALRWDDVDLSSGVIRVQRSYDPRSGTLGEPKSRAGRRDVPIASVLRDYLVEHKLRTGRRDRDLVFGRTADQPFNHSSLIKRSNAAWRAAEIERARLAGAGKEELLRVARSFEAPLTLHEARHTFASMMIAAGVNPKSLSTYLGHSSIAITMDRYGHLMPGNEEEAAGQLDGYLERHGHN